MQKRTRLVPAAAAAAATQEDSSVVAAVVSPAPASSSSSSPAPPPPGLLSTTTTTPPAPPPPPPPQEPVEEVFLRRLLNSSSTSPEQASAGLGLSPSRIASLLSALHWTGLELSRQLAVASADQACDLSEHEARAGLDRTLAEYGDKLYIASIASLVPSIALTLSCPSALHVDVRARSLAVSSNGVPIEVKQRQPGGEGGELVLL